MRAEPLRARLSEGPATWAELAEATGWSEQRCMVEVAKLRASGCTVEIHRVTVVSLLSDSELPFARTCSWPSCRASLPMDNESGYCSRHAANGRIARLLQVTNAERKIVVREVARNPLGFIQGFIDDARQVSLDIDATGAPSRSPSPFCDLDEVTAEATGVPLSDVAAMVGA